MPARPCPSSPNVDQQTGRIHTATSGYDPSDTMPNPSVHLSRARMDLQTLDDAGHPSTPPPPPPPVSTALRGHIIEVPNGDVRSQSDL